jgi:hypothetical protein
MDEDKLNAAFKLFEPVIVAKPVEVVAATGIKAKSWSIDMSGICPDCGEVMRISSSMGHKVLLCEKDRIVLPMPDDYKPPVIQAPTPGTGTTPVFREMSYGSASYAEPPQR